MIANKQHCGGDVGRVIQRKQPQHIYHSVYSHVISPQINSIHGPLHITTIIASQILPSIFKKIDTTGSSEIPVFSRNARMVDMAAVRVEKTEVDMEDSGEKMTPLPEQ